MSKIRFYNFHGYSYIEHCPFCGNVEVDFDGKEFKCPECGAVVTFNINNDSRGLICDGPSESDEILSLWSNRKGDEPSADDLCLTAQKAVKDMYVNYHEMIMDDVWGYIEMSARLGKYECEIPVKYLENPESYEERKFKVEKKGDNYIVSWRRNVNWE